jgi:hypothetical protein
MHTWSYACGSEVKQPWLENLALDSRLWHPHTRNFSFSDCCLNLITHSPPTWMCMPTLCNPMLITDNPTLWTCWLPAQRTELHPPLIFHLWLHPFTDLSNQFTDSCFSFLNKNTQWTLPVCYGLSMECHIQVGGEWMEGFGICCLLFS